MEESLYGKGSGVQLSFTFEKTRADDWLPLSYHYTCLVPWFRGSFPGVPGPSQQVSENPRTRFLKERDRST